LDHHGVGRCEMWQVQKALAPFDKWNKVSCNQTLLLASMVALEEGWCADEQINKVNGILTLYGGCLESVQQDAIAKCVAKCGLLECHTWRICHASTW
jgi:hypothetical protein